MAGMGHEGAFPPTTLSNRSRLGKPTFAGTLGNEQDAPISAIGLRSVLTKVGHPSARLALRMPVQRAGAPQRGLTRYGWYAPPNSGRATPAYIICRSAIAAIPQ